MKGHVYLWQFLFTSSLLPIFVGRTVLRLTFIKWSSEEIANHSSLKNGTIFSAGGFHHVLLLVLDLLKNMVPSRMEINLNAGLLMIWPVSWLFFIPGLLIISSNGILFFFIGREIHETLAGAPKSDQRDRRKEFRVYISIYVSIGLSWVFGYLMFLVPEDVVITIFLILFTITTPLQGFFIFVFYCLNKKVAAKWAGLFGYCIPCCKSLEESWTTQTPSGGSASGQSRSAGSSRSGIDSASSASSM